MADPDFGSDFSGILDVDPALSVVSGLQLLAEQLLRLLTSGLGTFLGSPAAGYDVRELLHEGGIDEGVAAGRIEEQMLNDERVQAARATVLFDARAHTLSITVEIQTALGPFSLVVNISDAKVETLIRIAA